MLLTAWKFSQNCDGVLFWKGFESAGLLNKNPATDVFKSISKESFKRFQKRIFQQQIWGLSRPLSKVYGGAFLKKILGIFFAKRPILDFSGASK